MATAPARWSADRPRWPPLAGDHLASTGNQHGRRDDHPSMALTSRAVAALLVASTALLVGAGPVAAHTEPDLVGIPAGDEVTLMLRPTHGCDDAATVEVSARVPVAGATADAVDGWTASAVPDDAGNTVVTWTGGVLPSDETGAFPTTFTTPDTVGELLTFPFVQTCEDGAELAWISGDPADDYPAPRVLVLAAGSAPAATIDDVPADAPGRSLLVEIVDVDGTEAPTTTAPDPTTGPETTTTESSDDVSEDTGDADTGDADTGGLPVVAVLAGLALGGIGGYLIVLRRRRG